MAVDPSELRRGIYRVKNPAGMEEDAQVEDLNGENDTHLPESSYRARGYKPPFEQLPWRDEYFAAKAKKGSA